MIYTCVTNHLIQWTVYKIFCKLKGYYYNIHMLAFLADHTDFFTDVSAIEVMKGGNTSVTVTFIADGIPDEPDESFTLNLEPKPFTLQTIPRGEAVFFRSTITLTIMDSKGMKHLPHP